MVDYHSEELWNNKKGEFELNPNYIPGCNRTRLVQRLKRPRASGMFSFGGAGYINGGFTDEGWKIVKELCSFAYMGSAEFEFGAVPEAFEKMSGNYDQLEGYVVDIIGNPYFPFGFRNKIGALDYQVKEDLSERHVLEGSVFVIAPSALHAHVCETIKTLALDEYASLKENSELQQVFFINPQWEEACVSSDTCGWLELDNGFMFFKDRGMWQNFCQLFEVDISMIPDDVKEVDFSAVDAEIQTLLGQAG